MTIVGPTLKQNKTLHSESKNVGKLKIEQKPGFHSLVCVEMCPVDSESASQKERSGSLSFDCPLNFQQQFSGLPRSVDYEELSRPSRIHNFPKLLVLFSVNVTSDFQGNT